MGTTKQSMGDSLNLTLVFSLTVFDLKGFIVFDSYYYAEREG